MTSRTRVGCWSFMIFAGIFGVYSPAAADDLPQPRPGNSSSETEAPSPASAPVVAKPLVRSVPSREVSVPEKVSLVPSVGSTASVDYKKFRDPFKEPVFTESQEIRSDLERFAVTDFKVTGVITGPIRMRAMLVAPDGKTHYVAEKMKLGLRDGTIKKITTKSVVVQEKVVNPLGEVEVFDTEIGIDQAVNTTGTEY